MTELEFAPWFIVWFALPVIVPFSAENVRVYVFMANVALRVLLALRLLIVLGLLVLPSDHETKW